MAKALSVIGESAIASEAAKMEAPNVWALEAALVVQQEEAIHAALAPLGRTLMDDVQAYLAASNEPPWIMVDAQGAPHEVRDTNELEQLCEMIQNECLAVRETISASLFIASEQYPQTPDGMKAWAEDKQHVIDDITSTIETLAQGAQNEHYPALATKMLNLKNALQQWGTAPDSLCNNLQALRNTLTNIRNADGLKNLLRNNCQSSLNALRVIVNDVENTCGIDPQSNRDPRRLANLPLPENYGDFVESGDAKGLKNRIEGWLDHLRNDARPTDTFDPAVFLQNPEKSNTALEVPFSPVVQEPRTWFRRLLQRVLSR